MKAPHIGVLIRKGFVIGLSCLVFTCAAALSTYAAAPSITTASPLPAGAAGVVYSPQTLAATGGTSPYTWSLASGSTLPAGLTLSAAGVISGTPTTAGTFNFTVQVTDSATPTPQTASKAFSLTVSLSITTASPLPNGAVALPYSPLTFTAIGGTGTVTWAVTAGTLPGGLTLSTAGVLSGTPTTAVVGSTFTVQAADSATPQNKATKSISLTIVPALSVSTASPLPSATAGSAYSQTLAATNGTAPYSWSVSSGTLPAGLTLSSAGVISGTPTTPGPASFTVQVTDSGPPVQTASKPLSLTVNPAALAISTTSPLAAGAAGVVYSPQTLAATGGTSPYNWSLASGSTLPAGLTLSTAGVISGTPTTAGTFSFTVQVADSATPTPQTASKAFSLTVSLSITTASPLPNGAVALPYSPLTFTAIGGTAPYTWTVTTGTLPAGLTLSTSGVISGTPTTAGTSTVTVQAADSATPTQNKATKSISLTIVPALSVSTASPLPSATAGSAYSQTLAATNGTAPYSWSVSSGSLPAGLTLSSAGVISGTPTTPGPASFTVQVTDSGPPVQTASKPLSLTVNPAALAISTTSPLAAGAAGVVYSPQTLAATGGTSPYNWSLASGSTLPAGLTLSTAGVISGTPTTAGTFSFTVQVADSATPTPQTASKAFSLTVSLSITTASPLPNGAVALPYSPLTFTAIGGTAPYTWTVTTGTLPAGLTLSTSGVISGTPTTAGTSTVTVQAADSATPTQNKGTKSISLTIVPALSVSTASPLPSATAGSAYSQTLAATNGTAPYSWSVSLGSLPAGLTLSSAGVISGTPTTPGPASFTVQVTDSGPPVQTASKPLSLTVNPATLVITTTSPLPTGAAGAPYSQTLTATGGTPPYFWSVTSGTVPVGLTLSAAGVLSGTPTTPGTTNFTVQAVDSGTPAQTDSKPFSLTFGFPPISITTASPLVPGTVGATYSQTVTAIGGTPPYTWSLTSGALPAGLTLSSGGVISGTATSPGSYSVIINVTDNDHAQVAKAFDINIASSIRIDTTSLPAGVVGKSYQQTLSASGGVAPYSWSFAGGNLPGGISLSSAGVLSGTPSAAGSFSFVLRVADSSSPSLATTQAFGLVFTNGLSITQSNLNNGSVGVAYSITMSASGGTPPYSWSIANGQLPPGLTLSSAGMLSGTPTTTGNFNFAVQVSDSNGALLSQPFSISIQTGLTITTASPLPNALVNSAYSQQMQASISDALNWSVISGSLPPGVKLDSGGLISGTPTTVGVFDFTVQVNSGGTQQQVAAQPFRIVVAAALGVTSASALPDATLNVVYATTLTATGGIAPYTWTRTTGSLPDGLALSSSGVITGTPNHTGTFTFTVEVSDTSNLKTSSVFTMTVVTASIGSLSLVNVPDATNPTQQLPIGMSLSAPQSNPVSGSLTMTFIPNSVVPIDDPAVQFSSGSRTVAFSIPQNATAAVFPTTVFLLTGSVSGMVVLTADFQDGPKQMPVGSIAITSTPPRMTNIVPVRTPEGLKIQIVGYSPERRIITADFDFDVKAATGTQRVHLTRNVESQFDEWYRSASSTVFGSSFVFEQLFLVQGDSSLIQSVAVSLTNGQGSVSSAPVSIGSIP